MEAVLNQILNQLKDLKKGQVKLEQRMDKFDTRIDKLDARMNTLDSRMDKLEKGQAEIICRLDNVEKTQKAIFDQTANLTEFRTEVNTKLDKVTDDIDFLKHK